MINASFATFLATPDTFPPPENWTSTRTWHSILLPLTRSIWSRDNDGNAFQRFYLMRGFDRKLAFEENIFSLETIYPILDGLNIDGRRKEGEKHACANYFEMRKCGQFSRKTFSTNAYLSSETCHFSCRAEDGLLLHGTSSSRSIGAIKEWNDVIP